MPVIILNAKNAREFFFNARDKNGKFLRVTKKMPVTILGEKEIARYILKSARDNF